MSSAHQTYPVERFPLETGPSSAGRWDLPAWTKADHLPPLKSSASMRGAILGPDNRIRVYESYLEARIMMWLMTRQDVARLEEQKLAIWADPRVKRENHYFDFIVTMTSGLRIAVIVKPQWVVEKDHWEKRAKEMARALSRKQADRVKVLSETTLDRIEQFNAETLHTAIHHAPCEEDRIVARVVDSMTGPMTIREIRIAAGLGGEGFWPIAKLILVQRLRLVHHVKITPRALLRRADDDQRAPLQ